MKKAVCYVVVILAFLIFSQSGIYACSCPTVVGVEQELKWKLKELEAVFSGEVLEINEIPQSLDVSVKIKVETVWKGSPFREVTIITPNNSASCGYPFEVGKSYVVFANRTDKNYLTTGLCLRNREVNKATEELKILGKGKKPKKNKS
jgi:hypothetical protein